MIVPMIAAIASIGIAYELVKSYKKFKTPVAIPPTPTPAVPPGYAPPPTATTNVPPTQLQNLGYSIPVSNTLYNGEKMQAGDTRSSSNLQYVLLMQTDGNLVLYRSHGRPATDISKGIGITSNDALWSTNTNDGETNHAWMQEDGNLVLYTPDMRATWATNTNDGGANYLTLSDLGQLVLRGPNGNIIWRSMSNIANTQSALTASTGTAAEIQNRVRALNLPLKSYTPATGDKIGDINDRFTLGTLDMGGLNPDTTIQNFMGRGYPIQLWNLTPGKPGKIPAGVVDGGPRPGAMGTLS
jgi:hypothetical protein